MVGNGPPEAAFDGVCGTNNCDCDMTELGGGMTLNSGAKVESRNGRLTNSGERCGVGGDALANCDSMVACSACVATT